MAKIAVVHHKFETRGGAEVVCMHTLEALQNQCHDLTLISFDRPDFRALNEFCGTNVDSIPVRRPHYLGPVFNKTIASLENWTNGRIGAHIKLKTAILNRLIISGLRDYDLSISTSSELALPPGSVQYIHYPRFNSRLRNGSNGANGVKNTLYDVFCSRLGGVNPDVVQETELLTNSNWTANIVEERYSTRPLVIPPPVLTEEFNEVPWDQRQNGFVTIGRIAPDKNVLQMILIIEQLRDLGHDIHLHIVGPTADYNTKYASRVHQLVDKREYLFLEGEVSRQELVELVCSHRFGLHGKPDEHFGIGIAELVAGGTLPFVPDSGGQVELVNEIPELTYTDQASAIQNIETVLTNEELALEIRNQLPDVREEFGRSRFQAQILDVINRRLAQNE